MDSIAHKDTRPVTVKFALILLALNTGDALVMSLIYAQWGNLSADISFVLFLILNILPLWFIFRRKNWARWFVAILTSGGVCYSPLLWVRDHQTFSAFYTVWFWLSDLLALQPRPTGSNDSRNKLALLGICSSVLVRRAAARTPACQWCSG
jgi:hypothetical protein